MKQYYPKGLEHILNGNVDYKNDKIIVVLVDLTLYTPDFNEDEYLSDIPSNAIVAKATLYNKVNIKGVADADDVLFPRLTGRTITAYLIVKDTSNIDTSILIVFNDGKGETEVDDPDTPFPIVPDGTDYTLLFSNGSERIFSL